MHDKRKLILKTNELKLQKINAFNYEEYIDAEDTFFDFVQSGRIKIRIFFRPNRVKPTHLSHEQKNNEYFLLYYQFLKHAFGLRFLNDSFKSPEKIAEG